MNVYVNEDLRYSGPDYDQWIDEFIHSIIQKNNQTHNVMVEKLPEIIKIYMNMKNIIYSVDRLEYVIDIDSI